MKHLLLGLTLSTLAGGCIALSCDEAGCNGTYSLTFEADDWADGTYELFVSFDGMEGEICTIVLPLEANASCDGFGEIVLDAGALTASVRTPMNEDLVEAEVELSLDGVVLLSEIVTPAWGDPYWPNGKACDRGYGCLSASDAFSL